MRYSVGILLFVFLISCSSKKISHESNETLISPQKVEETKKGIQFNFHPQIDVLFVVDSSLSMKEYQENLSENIKSFANRFFKNSFFDYHVGVITSSMREYKYQPGDNGYFFGVNSKFITNSTPYPELQLRMNLLVGIAGSTDEKFFAPVIKAITPPLSQGYNKGFYREDAYLAILFITDTDDQSFDWDPQTFYQKLLSLKKNRADKILSYGALVPPYSTDCERDFVMDPSRDGYLIEFIQNYAHGSFFNLCSDKYGEELARVGEDLVKRIEYFVPLKRLPDVNSIVVKWGHQMIPQDPLKGWSYDASRAGIVLGRDIKLNDESGAELKISFDEAIDSM